MPTCRMSMEKEQGNKQVQKTTYEQEQKQEQDLGPTVHGLCTTATPHTAPGEGTFTGEGAVVAFHFVFC